MNAARDLAPAIGLAQACRVLGLPRSTAHRRLRGKPMPTERPTEQPARARHPRALSDEERRSVLDVLRSDRFVNTAPAEVVATLLDEGVYLASTSTMYRILRDHDEVRERRRQRQHPNYTKPELIATRPNEVWSWDITKLKGPIKGCFYSLYVILDIYSRCVVGWMMAERESAALAQRLIAETCERQGIRPDQLTLHADRGAAMTARSVAHLLAELGVVRSHNRPHTSNDNPFSESQFKTLKYHSDFPDRFGSFEDARSWCRAFFAWYNGEHRHGGIAMFTPDDVHSGRAKELIIRRQDVLNTAYASHPERFVKAPPRPKPLPEAVWINPPVTPVAGGETSHIS